VAKRKPVPEKKAGYQRRRRGGQIPAGHPFCPNARGRVLTAGCYRLGTHAASSSPSLARS
jgi:hypothetical protein